MGVSGTKQIAITVQTGTMQQYNAVYLHVVTVPNRYTIVKPKVTATPAQEVRIPKK